MVTLQVNRLIDGVAGVLSHSESSPEDARRITTFTTADLGVPEVSIRRAVS